MQAADEDFFCWTDAVFPAYRALKEFFLCWMQKKESANITLQSGL